MAGTQFFLSAETRFKSFCTILLLYAFMQCIANGFLWDRYDDPAAWLGALGSLPVTVVWLFIVKTALQRWHHAQLGDSYMARREELTERVEELKRQAARPTNYDLTESWPGDEESEASPD